MSLDRCVNCGHDFRKHGNIRLATVTSPNYYSTMGIYKDKYPYGYLSKKRSGKWTQWNANSPIIIATCNNCKQPQPTG